MRLSLFPLLFVLLPISKTFAQSAPAAQPQESQVVSPAGSTQLQSTSPLFQSVSPQVDSDDSQEDSSSTRNRRGNQLPSATQALLLTSAAFADVTASPGDSNVEIDLGGTGFQVGMQADFDGTSSGGVAVMDDSTASIRVTLPSSFDINAPHKVQLRSPKGDDAGIQYLSNRLIPRGADLKTKLKADRQETKELARYTKVTDAKARVEVRANAAQRRLDIAKGKTASGLQLTSVPSTQVVNPKCRADDALEKANIRVRRTVMSPKEASDAFGRRLGRHYIAFQITVENKSGDYQYILHNVSVDLSTLMGAKKGTYEWAFSTQELSMLRGVPEKGQDYDPRNLTLHILRSVGSVAGGVSGLTATGIQDIFSGTVAAYNGPLLSSFLDVFPDHTATQLNRLSDSAFTANSIVAKRAAKVFAIFVPADLVLTNSESLDYWREPMRVMSESDHDFRQADVCVDGAFITEVSSLNLTSVVFSDPSKVASSASVDLIVTGSNLVTGDTVLHAFEQAVAVTSIDSNKATGHAKVTLPTSYDFQKSYEASLESTKTSEHSGIVNIAALVKPVLTSISFDNVAKAVPGGSGVVMHIIGSHLIQGDTTLLIFGGELPLQQVSADGTSGQVTAVIPSADKYDASKNLAVTLKTKSGLISGVSYLPATALTLTDAKTSVADAAGKVTLTLIGTGMLLADTQVLLDNGTVVALTTASTDGTTGKVKLTPPIGSWPGAHTVVLQTTKRGKSVPAKTIH